MIRLDSLRLFLLVFLSGLLLACSGARSAVSGSKAKERSSNYVLKQLALNQVGFEDLSGKAKIRYDDGEQKVTFQATVRMQQDSFIWVSASVLSYEVARLMIRPDSIFLINRWEKTYLADSYAEFDNTFQIPVTFDQLQSIVIGNMLLDPAQHIDMDFTGQDYMLSQNSQLYNTLHEIDGLQFRPKAIKVEDRISGYSVDARLEEYKPLDKSGYFPYFREYMIKNNNVFFANIQLNFTSLETNKAKNAPFEIPDNYTPGD